MEITYKYQFMYRRLSLAMLQNSVNKIRSLLFAVNHDTHVGHNDDGGPTVVLSVQHFIAANVVVIVYSNHKSGKIPTAFMKKVSKYHSLDE